MHGASKAFITPRHCEVRAAAAAQHLPSTPYAGSCNVGSGICLAARRSILFHNPTLKVRGGTCIHHPTTQCSLYSMPYTLPGQLKELVHRQFGYSLLPNVVTG
jgi:hypothetical protein